LKVNGQREPFKGGYERELSRVEKKERMKRYIETFMLLLARFDGLVTSRVRRVSTVCDRINMGMAACSRQ
jgi:hypothetical protein